MSLGWAPREKNAEADDITNAVVSAFDPRRRVRVDPLNAPWIYLPQLLVEATAFKAQAAIDREIHRASVSQTGRQRKRPAETRLQFTEPW